MTTTWPARLPRDHAALIEMMVEHAWSYRLGGASANLWLVFVANKSRSRRVSQAAPHVAELVWSGFFDE
jgi:hypothetical protein